MRDVLDIGRFLYEADDTEIPVQAVLVFVMNLSLFNECRYNTNRIDCKHKFILYIVYGGTCEANAVNLQQQSSYYWVYGANFSDNPGLNL